MIRRLRTYLLGYADADELAARIARQMLVQYAHLLAKNPKPQSSAAPVKTTTPKRKHR